MYVTSDQLNEYQKALGAGGKVSITLLGESLGIRMECEDEINGKLGIMVVITPDALLNGDVEIMVSKAIEWLRHKGKQ